MEENNNQTSAQLTNTSTTEVSTTEPQKQSFIKKHLWKIISAILALMVIFFVILYFLPYDEEYDDLRMDDVNFDNEANDVMSENSNNNAKVIENTNFNSNPNIVSYLDNLNYTDGEENGTDLAIYEINLDNTLRQNYLNPEKKYQQEVNNIDEHEYLWAYTSQVFSGIAEKYFIKKVIINTDGPEGNLASMHLDDSNQWELVIDPADVLKNGQMFDNQDFTYTLVHEFGHLLTLNYTQVDHENYDENTCNTRLISEGCLYDSYSYQYFRTFWEGNIYNTWYDEVDGGSEDDVYYFYEDNSDSFITEYAATDPDEDIAESFANFVLRDKPSSTNLMKDQKVNFFYNYPNLVLIRQTIRDNVAILDPSFFSKPLIIK